MICKIIHTSVIIFCIKISIIAAICHGTNQNPMIFDTPNGKELLKRCKAADIMSAMNLQEDPCNNFYSFACGNWQRINSAQTMDTIPKRNKFKDFLMAFNQKVYKFLNNHRSGDEKEDKVRHFYESCKIIAKGPNAYRSKVKKFFEEYGQLSFSKVKDHGNSNPKFSWWSSIAKINNIYDMHFILSLRLSYDIKDKNRTMIFIGPPSSELNMKQSSATVEQYLVEFLKASSAEYEQVRNNVYKFQNALYAAGTDIRSWKSVEQQYTLHNTTDLQEQYQHLFDLESFVRISLNITELPPQLYVMDKAYLDDLGEVFRINRDDVVEDYIVWLLLKLYLEDPTNVDLDAQCASRTNHYFGKYIQHIIYAQYRCLDYEREIHELWHEIRAVFHEGLAGDRYQWMSPVSRQYAIEKLNKMSIRINSYENENFNEFFKDLSIDPSNYMANIEAICKHIEVLREDKLQLRTDGLREVAAASYTPLYNNRKNEITIAISMLQPFQVWHPKYPQAIKYATWGIVLAHEMIHAFDDRGRYFDAQGNLNNWWDDKSANEFEAKRRCFQAQYHNYTFGGYRLPDRVAQGENIADNAAVKIAHTAYNRWLERMTMKGYDVASIAETFDYLPYNNQELFFISYAQLSCEDIKSELKSSTVADNTHPPYEIRVTGSLSNLQAFSNVFKCDIQPDATMNPLHKCDLF